MNRLFQSISLFFLLVQASVVVSISFKHDHAKRALASGFLVVAAAAFDIVRQSDAQVVELSDDWVDSRSWVEKMVQRGAALFGTSNWKKLLSDISRVFCLVEGEKSWLPSRAWLFVKKYPFVAAAATLSSANTMFSLYQLSKQPTREASASVKDVDDSVTPVVATKETAIVHEKPSKVDDKKHIKPRRLKKTFRVSARWIAKLKKRAQLRKKEVKKPLALPSVEPAGVFSEHPMPRARSVSDGGYVMPEEMLDSIVSGWNGSGREKRLKTPTAEEFRKSGTPWSLKIESSVESDSSDDELENIDEPLPVRAEQPVPMIAPKPRKPAESEKRVFNVLPLKPKAKTEDRSAFVVLSQKPPSGREKGSGNKENRSVRKPKTLESRAVSRKSPAFGSTAPRFAPNLVSVR